MKFKPFLLQNRARGSFALVHIDTEKLQSLKPQYDSFQAAANTPYSPIKKIHLSSKPK